MTTIVATAKNLEDLIETKPTQRGRLLTKFIGLDPIEKKEAVNKKMMSDFKSKMKSNIYNLKDLEDDITECEETIIESNKTIIQSKKDLSSKDSEIKVANTKKEKLLAQKIEIDDEIVDVNPQALNDEIEGLIAGGVSKKTILEKTLKEITDIGEVDFDDDKYNDIVEDQVEFKLSIGGIEKDIEIKEKSIKGMKEGDGNVLDHSMILKK